MVHTTGTNFRLLPPDARQLFMKLRNLELLGEAVAPTRGTSARRSTITAAITISYLKHGRIGYPDLQSYFRSTARSPT